MKKIILLLFALGLVITTTTQYVEARGRYGSYRAGGYTSHGKGSHYIGGYKRSCHGWACR